MENKAVDLSYLDPKTYIPNLHDVFKILGRKIVGEEESRLSLFVYWILARKYTMLTGPSRSGKTFIKDAIKDLILGDVATNGLCYTMKQGSDKSGWYAAEEICKASFVDIPELNQLSLGMNEVLKTWGEDKPATYDVVELMHGKRQNKKHVLPFRPFTFAIADENNMSVPIELRYRLIEIRTDGSQGQTDRIIESQAQAELNPLEKLGKKDIGLDMEMQQHIRTMPIFEDLLYVNPLATFVSEKVPKNFTDARTAHPVFQDSIKGLQRFYWKQSMIKVIDGKRVLFISPQTVMENYIVNGRTFLNSVMKCNDVELEMLNILKSADSMMKRKEIATSLRRKSVNIRDSIINKHLLNLEEMNYVDVSTTGSTKHYLVNEDANMEGFNIKGSDVLEHARLIMESLHPEYYDEYVETYLDRPTFIHPFTGQVVDLRRFDLGTSPKQVSGLGILDIKPTYSDKESGIFGVTAESLPDDEPSVVMNLEEWKKDGKPISLLDFEDTYGHDAMLTVLSEGDAIQKEAGMMEPLK